MTAKRKPTLSPDLLPFRFRRLNDRMLVTNDIGRYALLTPDQFKTFTQKPTELPTSLATSLRQNEFLKTPGFVSRVADVTRWRNDHLDYGPNLHIVILSLRCNFTCLYCHASRLPMSSCDADMSLDTARNVVDRIFESTSKSINIEFQGGEPLANWPVLEFIVTYAEEKNKDAGKDLAFTLVTNLSLMDDEKMTFLIDHAVYVCTSLDGPKELHEKNRLFTGGSSYDLVVEWIGKFHEEYAKRGFDLNVFHVDALMTTTRATLPLWKEVVDEYVRIGLKSIHLRPLNPFGFVQKTWEKIGYSMSEFVEFYKRTFDYVIELNLNGTDMIERMAAVYLTRILSDRDPNYMELRSPCGAGIGQIAYNYDGKVFTCDEGRMMSRMGEDMFQMGTVTDSYTDLIESDAVRTLVLASVQDGLPLCSDCAYKPYCGVCPIYNFATQGDIFGQMPTNGRCQLAMAQFDHLFQHLLKDDADTNRIFERWITVKIRQMDACDPY